MNIGIDIDDTTVSLVNSMIKYADIYDKEIGGSGINGEFGLIKNRYYLKSLYGWDDETKSEFFNRYYKKVLEDCVMKENANKVINKLKEEGHLIYFITARITSVPNCDTKKITENTLKNNGINYDELLINCPNKLEICKEKSIDIFIEDSFETCSTLEENGIKTYLMTTPMNEKINSGTVERVICWEELDKKIHNFIKSKK